MFVGPVRIEKSFRLFQREKREAAERIPLSCFVLFHTAAFFGLWLLAFADRLISLNTKRGAIRRRKPEKKREEQTSVRKQDQKLDFTLSNYLQLGIHREKNTGRQHAKIDSPEQRKLSPDHRRKRRRGDVETRRWKQ